jgi:hypothetical protein
MTFSFDDVGFHDDGILRMNFIRGKIDDSGRVLCSLTGEDMFCPLYTLFIINKLFGRKSCLIK